MPTEEKKITLPFREYLDDLLGSLEHGLDKKAVTHSKAMLINAIDLDHQYVHVQFQTFEGQKIEYPLVWRIQSYRSSYLKWQLDKQRSAELRHIENVKSENTALVAKKLSQLAAAKGVNVNDPVLQEAFRKMGYTIAKKVDEKSAKTIGVTIEKP